MKTLTGLMIIFMIMLNSPLTATAPKQFKEIRQFDAPEARQGVAVDGHFFYAIGTREIGKYDKKTGALIAGWREEKDGPIHHLDSGVIHEGKLYCAHSNYPGIPMTSSVEIWDANSLQHIGSHSFGIRWGSCTWIDRHDDRWWAAFAHYDKLKSETLKGTEWTTIVQFDDNWIEMQAWVFPDQVIELFRPMSNSGGSWGADDLLYCTGHDKPETYVLQIPQQGSILKLIEIIPINTSGQGIAWDRGDRNVMYTINKQNKKVIVFKMVYQRTFEQ